MSMMTRRDHLALLAAGSLATGFALGAVPAAAQAVRWSGGTETPRIAVPANATDCHHPIYDARFPPAPAATLRPPDACVEDYRALQRRLGLTRHVVVQPSTYGTDNRATLDGVAQLGASARAVVVVDLDVTEAALKDMAARGAVGIRVNFVTPQSWGVIPTAQDADASIRSRASPRSTGPLTHLEFSTPNQRLGENSRTEPKVVFNDRWYHDGRAAGGDGP